MNIDTPSTIEGIKMNIYTMLSKIENIEIKSKDIMFPICQIGEELLDLSMKMLNTGIQTFNFGSNLSSIANYFNEFKKISEEINFLINKYNQPTIMMQQQMLLQQQMMMKQQMMMQQIPSEPKKPKINAVFRDTRGKITNIVVENDITIEELYKIYVDRAPLYGHDKKDLHFIMNGRALGRKDKTKIKDYFKSTFGYDLENTLPLITVRID